MDGILLWQDFQAIPGLEVETVSHFPGEHQPRGLVNGDGNGSINGNYRYVMACGPRLFPGLTGRGRSETGRSPREGFRPVCCCFERSYARTGLSVTLKLRSSKYSTLPWR